MSYIYRIDGTLVKTNIIEHMNECPIPDPCPICDVIKEDNIIVSSKISEPYVITRKMNETNIINIIEEYIDKLTQYDPDATQKYILYNSIFDLRNFIELTKAMRISYRMQDNLDNDLGKLSDFDKSEVIRNLFENNNVKNIPKFRNVGDGFIIKVNYEPITEGFNIMEGFNTFNIAGSFNLIIIDLEVETDLFYRYILLSLSEKEKIGIKNALVYNIPIEVSEKNNNVSPNSYQSDEILKTMKLFLQKIFLKPHPEKYIYYTKELSECYNSSINFLTEERGLNDRTENNITLEEAKTKALNDISVWALEYDFSQKNAIFRTLKADGSKPIHDFKSKYPINEVIDPNNNYNYSCSVGSSFQIFNVDTMSKTQEDIIRNTYPGKEPSYYSCIQGCSGSCTKSGGKSILADTYDTYLKKDIILEHPDYQRYSLYNEKGSAPIGNSLNINGGNCQNTMSLNDAVAICNETMGCESFFRYLPGSEGAQTDGSMRTCFKGYSYLENDLEKIADSSIYKGDMYVKKNKKTNYYIR